MARQRNAMEEMRRRRGLKTKKSSLTSLSNFKVKTDGNTTAEDRKKNYETRMKESGVDPEKVKDDRNWLEKALNLKQDQGFLFDVLEILDRPRNALASGVDKALSGDNFFEGLGEGISGKKETSVKDLLVNHAGMKDVKGKLNLVDVLGFTGDLLTDPVDWALIPLTGGASAAVSASAQAADTAGDVAKVARNASKAAKAIDKSADALRAIDKTGDVAKVARNASKAIDKSTDALRAIDNTGKAVKNIQRVSLSDILIDKVAKPVVKKAFKKGDDVVTFANRLLDKKELAKATKKASRLGYDNVDDFLETIGKKGEIATHVDDYSAFKKGVKDTFNQGKTTLGKLKLGRRKQEGASELLDRYGNHLKNLINEDSYNYTIDALRKAGYDVSDIDNFLAQPAKKGKANKITDWLKNNADSDLAKAIQANSDDLLADVTRLYESNIDNTIRGDKLLRDLQNGQTINASEDSIRQIQNILDDVSTNSGKKITYSTNLASERNANEIADLMENLSIETNPNKIDDLNRQIKALQRSGSSIKIDDIPNDVLDTMKQSDDIRNAFTNANLNYDLRYNADELRHLDELKNNEKFMNFYNQYTDTYKNLTDTIKKTTGMDFSDITNRSGYLRRAQGTIADTESQIKALDDLLASGGLDSTTEKGLRAAREELSSSLDEYKGTAKPFGERKYNQPSEVANREFRQNVEQSIKRYDNMIENAEKQLSENAKAQLREQSTYLKQIKNEIGDFKEGIRDISKKSGLASPEAKRYARMSNKLEKLGIKNEALDIKNIRADKTIRNIADDINDNLINKAFEIQDKSVSQSLTKNMNRLNTLNKSKKSLLKQIDKADNLSSKQLSSLQNKLNKINDNIVKEGEKFAKISAVIDGSIDNTIQKEIAKNTDKIRKLQDVSSEMATTTAKKEANTQIMRELGDKLSVMENSLDDAIKNTNWKLENISDSADDAIRKKIETYAKAKSILQSQSGKELFDLNFNAGITDFLKHSEYTNKNAQLWRDALTMGVFHDGETFIDVSKASDYVKNSKNMVKVNGGTLSKKLNNIQTIIAKEGDELFSRDALWETQKMLKDKNFFVDKRIAHLFDPSIDISGGNGARSLLNLVDKVNTGFKKFSTLTPGFHMRNIIGNASNMFLSGMSPAAIPTYLKKATDVLNSTDTIVSKLARGIALDATEEANFKLLRQFYEGGFTGAGTAVRDLEKVAEGLQIGSNGPINKLSKFSNNMNEKVDSLNRMAVIMYGNDNPQYLKKLGVNNSVEAAKYALMDPSNMSEGEREVLKKIIPFYTFTKQNLFYQATNISKNLPRYKTLLRGIDAMYDDLPEDSYYSYQKDSMQIPLPFANDNGEQMFLKSNLPLSDLGEFIENPVQRLVASSTPLIKIPVERATGKNTFTGEDLYYNAGQDFANALGIKLPEGVNDAASTAEHILNGLGLQNVTTNLIKKVTSIIENNDGTKSGNQLWSELFRSILQNTKQESVENSKLYEDLEKYQSYVSALKAQGNELPTLRELNSSANNSLSKQLKRRINRKL